MLRKCCIIYASRSKVDKGSSICSSDSPLAVARSSRSTHMSHSLKQVPMLNAPRCVFPRVHAWCVHQTLQSNRGEHDLQRYGISTQPSLCASSIANDMNPWSHWKQMEHLLWNNLTTHLILGSFLSSWRHHIHPHHHRPPHSNHHYCLLCFLYDLQHIDVQSAALVRTCLCYVWPKPCNSSPLHAQNVVQHSILMPKCLMWQFIAASRLMSPWHEICKPCITCTGESTSNKALAYLSATGIL